VSDQNPDYERIEKRMMEHYFWEEKKRLERIGEEVDKSGVPQITAQQESKTTTLRELYGGGRMSPSARMPVQGIGTETGRLTSEKSNMCYDRKCDSCGRECAAVPANLIHFNCGPCRFAERELTMRVVSQVKEAGKTGLALHDIQKAVAEVAKHPHAIAPNGNRIACDPHVSDLLAHMPVLPSRKERIYLDEPHKYKSQGAHAHSPPSDGFGGFLHPGDHRRKTFTVRPCENGTPGGRCLYSLAPVVNAHECQCDKCVSGRETISIGRPDEQGYVYVDKEKYDAGIAACFNKPLAPGMNHCKIGDAVQLIVAWSPGKRVGRIKEIQYTAPLQAVVEYETGVTETHQLHKLELVNACVEVSEEAEATDERYCRHLGRFLAANGRFPNWEEAQRIRNYAHQAPSPAGEAGETEPQECKLGKESDADDEFPCSCTNVKMGHNPDTCELREANVGTFDRFAFPLIRAFFPSLKEATKNPLVEEEMTARDAEESNRPALSSEKRDELYDAGKGVKYEPGTTKIVVQFNLPQEPPCTCENVNLPHTPNCPWKKWKNSKDESKS
jgi:hypothetical protein